MELSAIEVAKLLNVPEKEVRDWARADKLPHLDVQDRLRFNRQAILEWALARGHPLAGTGIAQIVELCWQLRGMAEGRQVSARVALAQSIGGLATNNWVTLLEARP